MSADVLLEDNGSSPGAYAGWEQLRAACSAAACLLHLTSMHREMWVQNRHKARPLIQSIYLLSSVSKTSLRPCVLYYAITESQKWCFEGISGYSKLLLWYL